MYCIPAGSISGVRIGIHWSFPLVLVLHAMDAYKHGAWWAGVVALTVVGLYVIIVGHEFGHVFAARREGIDSDRIMLWPLGGLAYLGEEATGPSEVRIAAAGPAVNLAVAFAMLPLLAVFGIEIGLGLVNPFAHWWPILTSGGAPGFGHYVLLGIYKANIIVLLFNLFPAFPMDGGRML
ncbi:MAG: site-2 protease family protein, partial [Planctomycetota bacterium]